LQHFQKAQVLLRDLDDGNIENVDFLGLDEVQEHLEGPFELLQFQPQDFIRDLVLDPVYDHLAFRARRQSNVIGFRNRTVFFGFLAQSSCLG
jgi:hypothetical protein